MSYRTRFVPDDLVNELLDQHWRRTAVGYAIHADDANIPTPYSRYGRMLRAARRMKAAHQELNEGGIYKDLDSLLGVGPGQINA